MFWFLLCSLWAAEPGAGASDTLARVRESALDNLRRLPNYTCTQTIERSYRNAAVHPFENVDRIRLEVGFIDGKEVFGWPGGERLAEEDLHRLVGGTVTNGEFALAIRALFAGRSAVFGDMRQENHGGHAALRFDFAVPRQGSDWILAIGGQRAPTGYHGSFWVDSDWLRLMDLRIVAEDVPSELGFAAFTRELQFQSVPIGTGEFLLPSRAQLSVTETGGAEHRNETRFHDCRQYAAESVISFGSAGAGGGAKAGPPDGAPAAGPAATLPDEFEASLELDSPIDSDTSAVGDPIAAHLERSIKWKGETVVAKGAVLHGRIARLDVTGGRRCADFAFTWFEADGRRVQVGGRKNELVTLGRSSSIGRPIEPVVGPIRSYDSHLYLPRGFSFLLKSAAGGK